MISERVKSILSELRLKHSELARQLEVPLSRVKNLTSGRIKKLTPRETRLFIERFNVRPEYLETGRPPIFKPPDMVETYSKVAEPMVRNYYFEDNEKAATGRHGRKLYVPDANAELGVFGRAAAIADEALIAAGLRRRATPDQFGTLCVITFALLARGSSAAAAREMLDQVLALCQPAPTAAETEPGQTATSPAETASSEPAEEPS